jgi:hypothetical protein
MRSDFFPYTFLEILTRVLQLRLSAHSHSGSLTWQKTYHKKLDPKSKMQNFLSFSD